MNHFFSSENPAMRFLSFLCDMMYINFLFIICCLPVFTIGASITAMYSVLFKHIRGEAPTISKAFFGAFKENFKKSTFFGVPIILLLIFFFADLYVVHNMLDASYSFLQYPIAIALLVIFSVSIYIFPQLAVFDASASKVLKNSFLLSLGNFPTTLLILIVYVLLFLLAGLSPKMTYIVGSILLFLGIATINYFFTIFFRRIFNKVLGEEDAV